MAIRSTVERKELWKQWMSRMSADREAIGTNVLKGELLTIVENVDVRIDAFLSGLNSPPVAKWAQLSEKQKVEAVLLNLQQRFEVL